MWHVMTDELALDDGALRRFLAPDEVARADRFRFGRDASRSVRRRWLLRRLLAAYGADPGTDAFATGPHGKPEPPAGATVRFNASSSGSLAVVAVSRDTPLGVDVERLRTIANGALLAKATMTASELAELATARDDEAYGVAFLRLWTLKEAFMKAHGTGLSLEPLRITTTATAADRWTVTSPDAPACSAFAVDVGSGAVASLALPGQVAPDVRTLALAPGMLS